MGIDVTTKCIHLENESTENFYGAVSFPIFQSATFAHPSVGNSTGYDYSRLQNPTREQLEKVVAALENGVDALAFSSGMAAISSMMELFRPGDHLIVDADLYGGTVRLFDHISRKNGIQVTQVDFTTEDVERFIQENTRAVYIETPTNPSKTFNIAGLQVSNIFIPNPELRRKFRKQINAAGYSQLNVMGLVAAQAAIANR